MVLLHVVVLSVIQFLPIYSIFTDTNRFPIELKLRRRTREWVQTVYQAATVTTKRKERWDVYDILPFSFPAMNMPNLNSSSEFCQCPRMRSPLSLTRSQIMTSLSVSRDS